MKRKADDIQAGGADALAREQAARARAEGSERRARVVADVALALASPVKLDGVLEAATEALVGAFPGGGAGVWLHDQERRRLRLAASRGYSPQGRARLADMGEDSETTMAEAFRRRDAVVYGLSDAGMPRVTRELASLADTAPVTVAAAPLLVAGRCLGALTLVSRGQPLDDSWLETLRAVGALVAAAVERTRLYEREREISGRLQGALLPALEDEALLTATGMTVAHRYRSGTEGLTVGGDFYDVWSLPPSAACPSTRLALLLGDISGKGLEAAVQTAALRHAVQAYAYEDPDPARVIARVSDLVLALDLLPRGFATMFFALVDSATGAIRYCSAGHESLLLRAASGATRQLDATAPALGLTGGGLAVAEQAVLESGGQFVLYTDGVTEARDPGDRRLLGVEGLAGMLDGIASEPGGVSAAGLASRLLGRVEDYAGGRLEDDAALLVILRPHGAALTSAVAASSRVG